MTPAAAHAVRIRPHGDPRNVTHTKAANLRLINTHSLAEVSTGVPTLGEGNADCRTQTIGSRSGLSCKMVALPLQTNGLSNTSIHIFPAIANSSLASAVGAYDTIQSEWQFMETGEQYRLLLHLQRDEERKLDTVSSRATSLTMMVNLGSAISTPEDIQLSL